VTKSTKSGFNISKFVNLQVPFSFLCCLVRAWNSPRRRPSHAWSACPCYAWPPRCFSFAAPSTCRPCSRRERASVSDAFCVRKKTKQIEVGYTEVPATLQVALPPSRPPSVIYYPHWLTIHTDLLISTFLIFFLQNTVYWLNIFTLHYDFLIKFKLLYKCIARHF